MAGIVIIVIWLAGLIGWVMNIVQIVAIAGAAMPVTTMFLLKCVGVVVAPLGAVLGYIG